MTSAGRLSKDGVAEEALAQIRDTAARCPFTWASYFEVVLKPISQKHPQVFAADWSSATTSHCQCPGASSSTTSPAQNCYHCSRVRHHMLTRKDRKSSFPLDSRPDRSVSRSDQSSDDRRRQAAHPPRRSRTTRGRRPPCEPLMTSGKRAAAVLCRPRHGMRKNKKRDKTAMDPRTHLRASSQQKAPPLSRSLSSVRWASRPLRESKNVYIWCVS
jgi:hypothetical protein